MAVQDATGRLHANAGQSNGGQFIPKDYNDDTGQYEGKSSWKTKLIKVGNKTIFNSSKNNPLDIKPEDDADRVFDKLIAMPLFIQNIDSTLTRLYNIGYEKISEGFGDERIDENRGIDYRVVLHNPKTGKTRYLKIDFKYIRLRDFNSYDNPSIPLHLLRDRGDAQFLNTKHDMKNHGTNTFMFMCLNLLNDDRDTLINIAQNGNIAEQIYGMKLMHYNSTALKEAIFNEFGSERDLREIANDQRERLTHGFSDRNEIVRRNHKTGKPFFFRKTVVDKNGLKIYLSSSLNKQGQMNTQLNFQHDNKKYPIPLTHWEEIPWNKIKY